MDKFFRNRDTNEPVTREDIQGGNPNRFLPLVFNQNTLDRLNLDKVKESPRPADDSLRTYSWRPSEAADGTFVQEWVPKYRYQGKPLLEAYKSFLIKSVGEGHKAYRDGGITFDGKQVGTDLAARTYMMMAPEKGSKQVVIKGQAVEFTATKYRALQAAVNKHVEYADKIEHEFVTIINKAETVEQLQNLEKLSKKLWK